MNLSLQNVVAVFLTFLHLRPFVLFYVEIYKDLYIRGVIMKQTADGLGTQLRRLLEMMDGDVEAIYRRDHPFYVPRFTPVMKALSKEQPLSIKEIAACSSISHSAASQTVAKLVDHGLVELVADAADRRSRLAALTPDGQSLLPWLEERWRATNAAAAELENELSFPLSRLLAEAISQLEHKPFASRISVQTSKIKGPAS